MVEATATATADTERKFKVSKKPWEGMGPDDDFEQWDKMLPVLEEWSGKLERDIVCYNPHGVIVPLDEKQQKKDDEKGVLRVYFFSCSSEANYPPENYSDVFGISTAELGAMYRPVGDGAPIIDEVGTETGEYYPNTLYVFYDLPHHERADELLEGTFAAAAPLISKEISIDDILAEQKAKKETRLLSRWVEVCSERREGEMRQLSQRYSTVSEELTNLQQEMTRKMRERITISEDIEVRSKMHDDKEKFEAEFRALLNTSYIASVDLDATGQKLIILTDELISTPMHLDGSKRNFGAFRFEYTLNSDELPTITALNGGLDVTGTGYHHQHPHVREANRPCWGSVASIATSLCATNEYAGLTSVLLKYLITPNEIDDQWGKYAYQWPVEEPGTERDPIPDYAAAMNHCWRCKNTHDECTC